MACTFDSGSPDRIRTLAAAGMNSPSPSRWTFAEVLTTVAAPALPSDERICLSVFARISQTEE
jgi:hypothetical protein